MSFRGQRVAATPGRILRSRGAGWRRQRPRALRPALREVVEGIYRYCYTPWAGGSRRDGARGFLSLRQPGGFGGGFFAAWSTPCAATAVADYYKRERRCVA